MLRKRPQPVKNYSPRVPSGLIALTESGYFLVKGQKRFKFISDRTRESWNLRAVLTTDAAIKDLRLSGIVGFRDGTFIRDISTSKIYLISDNKKRHVVDPDTLLHLGVSKDNIIEVSSREAALHGDGESLNV